jgi:ribonuclease R
MRKGITIDGSGSNDLDDAIWIEKTEEGYNLSISISHVSKYVEKDSPTDKKAMVSLFSIYRGNQGCIKPMIKRSLSENKLSLLKDQERDVVVFDITLNEQLEITNIEVKEDKFTNIHRLTYDHIPDILIKEEHELHAVMTLLSEISSKLLDERRQSGALAIYDIIAGWGTDEEGNLRRLSRHECNIGHIIIQEMMVLTNVAMSKFSIENDIPIMYRNHKVKIAAPEAIEFSKEIKQAVSANNESHIKLLNQRLALVSGRATMGSVTYGHYGLNLPSYSYFTSPIRRYPDLINHRNVIAFLHGNSFPYSKADIDAIAERYNEREREVKDDTKNFFKGNANDVAESRINLKRFTRLDEKELYRALKVAGEQSKEIPEPMQNEIVHRLNAGNLDHKSLALIFAEIGSGFTEDNRKKIISAIKNVPHVATAVYNILMQKFEFEEVKSLSESSGPQEKQMFTCTSKMISKDLSSTPIYAKSKKLSIQLSTLDLLQQLIGIRIKLSLGVKASSKNIEAVKQSKTPKKSLIGSTGNHKGDLQEWCQKNADPVPIYETKRIGPDHCPIFLTNLSVTISGKETKASCDLGANKKESQKLAAKKWLIENNLLREI